VKVGDLVQLSAYGKKCTFNFFVKGRIGLVVGVDNCGAIGEHPGTAITVRWSGQEKHVYQIRRDLKYAK